MELASLAEYDRRKYGSVLLLFMSARPGPDARVGRQDDDAL